jgi:dephospho-CoA kinase
MIIIINGSPGVGKTTVSWKLIERFEKAIFLDGDHLGAVHPFEIYDNDRIEYLYRTIENLVDFHHRNGYENIVLNYVFESFESLSKLEDLLRKIDCNVYTFRLHCADSQQEKQIRSRKRNEIEWELNRFRELNAVMENARSHGFIGEPICTDDCSVDRVCDLIMEKVITWPVGDDR